MPEVHAFLSIPTKILLPIDFSPSSQSALDMAADLAEHFHAAIHLVHIVPFFPTTTMVDFVPETSYLEEVSVNAKRRMASCHDALAARGVTSHSTVDTGNDVAGKIMEVVERERIDMVIISTHGISGWRPFVFGSIAEKVVKLVQCPLLLLRSAKPETATAKESNKTTEWW
jgi:nucleotide-binding universal stress UspA family protein